MKNFVGFGILLFLILSCEKDSSIPIINTNPNSILLKTDVIDAEYSKSKESLVYISSNPSTLTVFNTNSEQFENIPLNYTPTCVSVSQDGETAVVGHDGHITYVNLTTKTILNSYSISCVALDIVIGKGPSARTVRLDLPKFTLVGATTRFGLLSGPFRDRFGLVQRLEFYPPEGLKTIIHNAAKKLKARLPDKAAFAIAQRSRGTPRVALKLFKRVRDYAQVKNGGGITPQTVEDALSMFAIDQLGLDHNDRKFLIELINKHGGGPVGLGTIAATLHEDPGTIEEVIEPYLIQVGLLKRTTKGRVISKLAYKHLGLEYPEKK